ncbi:MAG TPA: hypothetical protein VKX49_20360 [Bryobacteraceae bacterium]|nr:hypothetical protein [Bryobacteraceae bacterium]
MLLQFLGVPQQFGEIVERIGWIAITERYSAQIEARAENLTNTPIFANPNTSIDSTSFGRITSTAGLNPARLIVLKARFNF